MDRIDGASALLEVWSGLSAEERTEAFLTLPPAEAEPFFLGRSPLGHAQLLLGLPEGLKRLWIRMLAPDDVVDALQLLDADGRPPLLALLDVATRHEVQALMAYVEDEAGGLMSPRFARVRPEMSVDEALSYLRRQARGQADHNDDVAPRESRAPLETIYCVYVLDPQQHLLGVVSFRELFGAASKQRVSDIMRRDFVSVAPETDQEQVAQLFAREGLLAIPVVDAERVIKGIITVDDIVDVVQAEATEDVQKAGGLEALDRPYLQMEFWRLVLKRAGWLAILFVGEMLTASAMGAYEAEIKHAVVLALFVPLIISSGGNSGSQASTLIIRAMALGEVRLRDWARILRRELLVGLALGAILALIGILRISIWGEFFGSYGAHFMLIALTVGISLVAIVMWGTLSGAMLPFLLRRVGLDPASASAPFVATLVDVSGLVIYFSVAEVVLGGVLL